jgi:hypothetical protein
VFSSLVLTPTTPVAGQPVNLLGTGTLSAAVTGGSGVLNVLYMGVPLYQSAFTTCGNTSIALPLGVGTVDIDSLVCPTVAGKAGSLSFNVTVTLPKDVPTGSYEITFTADDQNSKAAYCVDAQFNLGAAKAAALRGAAAQ